MTTIGEQGSVVRVRPGVRRLIAASALRAAPWNARKKFDEGALRELAQSIGEHGVLVDLTVRPRPGRDVNARAADSGPEEYEIVAGERRFRAARMAGLTELPCKVVQELSDEEARAWGLNDNLQREDLPAMEEAEAFAEMLETLGSIAKVAARVGKEQGYVAKRLRLCGLTAGARDAMAAGLIGVDHALLLARLGAEEQDAALKWCLNRNAGANVALDKVIADLVERRKEDAKDRSERYRYTWEPASPQSLKDHIASECGILLSRAPWDLADGALLADAPACELCPQNTKANAPLFGDLEMGGATCTDGACFKEKTQAYVQIQVQAQAQAGSRAGDDAPLRVSWKASSTAPRMEKDSSGPVPTQVFKDGQWAEAKTKSCEHVRAAVTVDWSDARPGMGKLRKAGERVLACIAPKCKAHPKAYEKAAGGSANGSAKGKQESWEDLQKREAAELAAFEATEQPVRRALYDAILAKLTPAALKRLLLHGAEVVNVATGLGIERKGDWAAGVKERLAAAKDGDLDRLLFAAYAGSKLKVNLWEERQPDKGRRKLREMALLVGVNARAIEQKAEAALKAAAKPEAKTPAAPVTKAAKKSARKGAAKAAKKAAKKARERGR